jgi:asparaginyl-tRNA synthetase
MTTTVKQLYANTAEFLDKSIQISGWVRSVRTSKTFGFIEFNDGSCYKNIQIVYNDNLPNFEQVQKLSLGSSIQINGNLVESQGKGQSVEVQAADILVIGQAALDNPIQKKATTFEFLREIPHLRPRTNTFKAVFRVRSLVAHAIHCFFQERDFVYIHTPIITGSDCEGAGEMFRVSTLDPTNLPLTDDKKIDYSQELLGKSTYLTVSGQLALEPFCFAFRNVYTFGPTFRAENSNTARHANEFWMIEPEIAFADLPVNMEVAEEMLKYIIRYVMDKAPDELAFFNERIDKGLIERLNNIVNAEFAHVTYTEAIEILKKSGKEFQYEVKWEDGLQTEHERYLAEEVFKKPVFVTDYPKEIKAFYMKLNADGKTVRAMDLLVPEIGEIIGGSQREENLEVLENRMKELGLSPEDYQFYIDVRKFGTFQHSGFGLGFERAVMYLTGMKNIRDVLPYPRTPNNASF